MIINIINNIFIPVYRRIDFPQKIFVFCFFVMSIDGFPLIPISSDNRPLSMFFLFMYWFIEKILRSKFTIADLKIFSVFLLLWFYTFLKSYFIYQNFNGLEKFTITGLFTVVTISSCLHFYSSILKKYDVKTLTKIVCYSIILGSLVPILVGFIQFFALKNLFPMNIANFITNIFSYRPLLDRIQMLNTEASHASNYMVLVILFIYSFYDNNKLKYKLLILAFVSFILIGSTVGYVMLSLTLVLYWLLFSKKDLLKTFKVSSIIFFILFIAFLFKSHFLNAYTLSKFDIVKDLMYLNIDALKVVASVDFSTYDRMFSPILGFLSLNETNYLGSGGESFFYLYEDLLMEYFPFALNNSVLMDTLNNGYILTIKFLPAKIAAELGIIPFCVFIYFIVNIFKKLNQKRKSSRDPIYSGLLLVMVYAILSTWACSYFNFNFIMIITLGYKVIKTEFVTSNFNSV